MKKLIVALLLAGGSAVAFAGGGHGVKLDPVKVDLQDQAALQRGAKLFVNYCLSCHGAAAMRYNRLGRDLGLTDEQVKQNLMFAGAKIGDLMMTAMRPEDGKQWFGTPPPDLSVIARARPPEWLYTYMRSFYRDDKTVSGWNNTVFPSVAMPHVLAGLQGQQRAVFKKDSHGLEQLDKFEVVTPGTLAPEQYDAAMRDLVSFLVYLGEPAKLERYRLGVLVLLFLTVFLVVAYLLKKEYWKDIH
jgi:ubiquinol-cytochrome c reductase cytochrome c1 subunit